MLWNFGPSPLRKIFNNLKDSFTTMQARIVIFRVQVDDDLLYRGIKNRSILVFFPVFVQFSFSPYLEKNEISRQRFLHNHIN